MTTLDLSDRRRRARAAQRWRHLADLDPVLLAAAFALSVLGVVLVWSASTAELTDAGQDPTAFAKRQAISLLIGLLLAYGVSRTPFVTFRVIAPWWYVVSIIGLVLTLTPLGVEVAGARAWLELPGGFTVQPSEFAKIGLILLLAVLGSGAVLSGDAARFVVRALAVCALPIGLVLLQNDTGTMLVLAAISFTMLVIAGVPARLLVGLAAAGALATVAVVRLGLLQDYQLARLTAFLDPEADLQATGFNALQARIAISGGGMFGQGLFSGSQTQGSFVPVNESDFIFTVAAEELGLVGAVALIALLGVVLWRGLRIAAAADDRFSRMVAVGIVAWFGFQAFENIGMNLGIMPITGVTLPFVSFGGSSLMATWIAVGVLQVLHIRRRRGVLVRPDGRLLHPQPYG